MEIHLNPCFTDQSESVIERGYDEGKGMKFIKVFFNEDVSV
jgi:hypothetical protein